MHIVHVELRPDPAHHAFLGAAAPVVGDLVPVEVQSMHCPDAGQCGHQAAMPVQRLAAGVEGQRLDVHRTRPGIGDKPHPILPAGGKRLTRQAS